MPTKKFSGILFVMSFQSAVSAADWDRVALIYQDASREIAIRTVKEQPLLLLRVHLRPLMSATLLTPTSALLRKRHYQLIPPRRRTVAITAVLLEEQLERHWKTWVMPWNRLLPINLGGATWKRCHPDIKASGKLNPVISRKEPSLA